MTSDRVATDGRVLEKSARLKARTEFSLGVISSTPYRVAELRSAPEIATVPPVSSSEISEAITSHQLFLEYQPKLDCHLGRITAVEALVRWRHPRLGIIGADRFIPFAERADLMDMLTGWVMENALNAAEVWHREGFPLEIAINISGRNLRDIELPHRMTRHCQRSGIAPSYVILELTETHALDDAVTAIDVLTRLRVAGFRLSIDDFGTGYSSLVQLHRLPFSELKIDRSFVAGLMTDQKCRDICEIIVALSRKLGLRCVAEGVENQGILSALMELGCDGAQGYYLSRPIDAADVIEFLQGYHRRPDKQLGRGDNQQGFSTASSGPT